VIIKRHMDMEMAELRGMLHDMGRRVLGMLERGLTHAGTDNATHFDAIFDDEVEVNRLQMRIDDLSWKVMALYQPTAGDLRALIGAIKVAVDLERVGDEVCAMCRRSMSLAKSAWHVDPPTLIELGIMVQSLFKDGLTALFDPTEELAESIFTADDAIDEAFQALFEQIRDRLRSEPEHVDSLLDFLSMGRSLERVADHATNLAEIAIFMQKGQDVRHHGLAF